MVGMPGFSAITPCAQARTSSPACISKAKWRNLSAILGKRVKIASHTGVIEGQATDINIQAQEIMRIKQILNGILADHSGRSIEDLEKDTDRDNFMSAAQAVEYGLVDEVVVHAE